MQMLRRKMGITKSFAQGIIPELVFVCTNGVHPLFSPTSIHTSFFGSSILPVEVLYTVSTAPTITTICLKKNETIKTGKRSLV